MLKEISSIKISKVTVFKFMVLGLLGVWGLSFGVSSAQERGIGVSPANIEIERGVEWPYTLAITVTNFSAQEERFEVLGAAAVPGRFSLGAGHSRRVFVTFEDPVRSTQGVIKVLSQRTSAEGFTTGTGVKVPFRFEKENENAAFLARAASSPGAFSYALGAGMILFTLLLLWHAAGIMRSWMLNSNKQ